MPTKVDTSRWKLPINLGLNDGTYCSPACLEELKKFDSITSLRNYSDNENRDLRAALAADAGVSPENIYLHNGSGPILKQAIPHIIKGAIKASPVRVAKFLLKAEAYPIITPHLTYGKVPLKALASGLKVRLIELDAEMRLDVGKLDAAIAKGDGLVYIANPNNPTGNVLISADDLEPLIQKYPGTTFWLDEAYVQYISPSKHRYIAPLVAKYPNLVVLRTMSFAYGLASLRVGWLIAKASLVAELESQVTDYRIPLLTERVAMAAVKDSQHLEFVRQKTAEAQALFNERMKKHASLQPYASECNFILVKSTGKPAKEIAAKLLERGVKIKTFSPLEGHAFTDLFRITVGTPEENEYCMDMLDEILA